MKSDHSSGKGNLEPEMKILSDCFVDAEEKGGRRNTVLLDEPDNSMSDSSVAPHKDDALMISFSNFYRMICIRVEAFVFWIRPRDEDYLFPSTMGKYELTITADIVPITNLSNVVDLKTTLDLYLRDSVQK